jgi:cell division protein FtsB
MKPIQGRTVRIFQLFVLFIVLISVGLLMGEKGLAQRQMLEEKKAYLQRENENLTTENRSLERKARLLRTDSRAIERAAKCKLGMARPDEAIYLFDDKKQ